MTLNIYENFQIRGERKIIFPFALDEIISEKILLESVLQTNKNLKKEIKILKSETINNEMRLNLIKTNSDSQINSLKTLCNSNIAIIMDFINAKNNQIAKIGQELRTLKDFRQSINICIKDFISDYNDYHVFKDFEYGEFDYNRIVLKNIEDVNNFTDRSLKKGICSNSPGRIIFTLSKILEFEEIEIGGWIGEKIIYRHDYYVGASIFVSTDKENWTKVGNIPNDYGHEIQKVVLTKSKAKYIKFDHDDLRIGYFRIIK